jgi:entericidin A
VVLALRRRLLQAGKMNRMAKYFLFIALLATFLSGCNTTRGFGEDLQHLGGAIERATNK